MSADSALSECDIDYSPCGQRVRSIRVFVGFLGVMCRRDLVVSYCNSVRVSRVLASCANHPTWHFGASTGVD